MGVNYTKEIDQTFTSSMLYFCEVSFNNIEICVKEFKVNSEQ